MENRLTNAGTEIGNTLGRGVDRASIGAHDTLNQIAEAAKPALDRVTSSAHDVIDTVTVAATSAVETLGVKGDQLGTAQEQLLESARTYVRDRPIASLGIAVACGWILGRLLR